MAKKKSFTPDEKKDMVLAYLKNKYNEDFEAYLLQESGWGQGSDEIYLYPANGPRENTFLVKGTIKDDGSYAMHDNYFKHIIKDEYEAVMTSFVKEFYKEFKLCILFEDFVYPDRLNKDTKINEIYNKDEFFETTTRVFVKQSEVTDIDLSLKKIAEKMVEYKLVGEVSICEVYDDKYEYLPENTLDIIVEFSLKKTEEFLVDIDGRFIRVKRDLTFGEVR